MEKELARLEEEREKIILERDIKISKMKKEYLDKIKEIDLKIDEVELEIKVSKYGHMSDTEILNANREVIPMSAGMRKYLTNKEYYDRKLLEHHSGLKYAKMLERYNKDVLKYNIKVVEVIESDDLIASIQNYSRDEYSTAMNGGIWTDYSKPKIVRFSVLAEKGIEITFPEKEDY